MKPRLLYSTHGLLVFASFAVVLLSPRPSRSEEAHLADDPGSAGALFAEAKKLVEATDYARACPKFEQSVRLKVGIGVQFNLADCWEHVGRTASARALFLGVAASLHAIGQSEREQVARARAEALEPRLSRMLLDVRATDPDLVVRRNQVSVERGVWGTAAPIDPGSYLIEATAPGKKDWWARVTVPATTTD